MVVHAEIIEIALEAAIEVARNYAARLIVKASVAWSDLPICPFAFILLAVAERDGQHVAAAADVLDVIEVVLLA